MSVETFIPLLPLFIPLILAGSAATSTIAAVDIITEDRTEDSTAKSTSIVMNWEKKTCMTKIGDGTAWDGVQLRNCEQSDNSQQFVYNADGTISNGDLKLITWNSDIKMENNNGYRWEFEGTRSNDKSGGDAVKNGPFRIKNRTWPYKRISIDKREGSNPLALRYENDNTYDDSQVWITRELYEKCEKLGLDVDNCNRDNVGLDKVCVKQENSPTEECKTWCSLPGNHGKCDTAVKSYCGKNLLDQDFCGCYNYSNDVKIAQKKMSAKGITLLPHCHIASCASNAKAYVPEIFKRSCPEQNICLQSFDIGGTASGDFKGVDFNCTQNTNNNTATGTDTGKVNVSNPAMPATIFIITGVSLLIIIIVFGIYLATK